DAVLAEIDRLAPDLVVVGSTGHDFPVEAERRVLERLAAKARSVVVMRQTPWFQEEGVACLRKTGDPARCEWPASDGEPTLYFPRPPEAAPPATARMLALSHRLCPNDRCRAVLDGRIVMFDSNHLTASFSRTLGGEFRAVLEEVRK